MIVLMENMVLNVISLIVGVLLGWGGSILLSPNASICGWVLVGIGLFGVLCLVAYGFSKKIWPNRDKWIAEFKHDSIMAKGTLDLQQTLNKDWRTSWTSPKPLASGDIYRISLGKHRWVDGIEFYEKQPTNQFPGKWTLLLENEWGGLVDQPIQSEGRIVIEFPSRKIYAIAIQVIQPNLNDDGRPYDWRIENVCLREVKLFHRWLRMLI